MPGAPQTWADYQSIATILGLVVGMMNWCCIMWNGARHRKTHRQNVAQTEMIARINRTINGIGNNTTCQK